MNYFVSVIIPVLNGAGCIDKCLSSLVNLDYPKDRFEIIVVDNGSTDNTLEIAKRYNVRLLQQRNCTISALRNLGSEHSKGQVLAFIDADCIAPRQWLTKAAELLENDELGAVGCWHSLPTNPSYTEKIWDINALKRRKKAGFTDWIPSCNLIIRKAVFEKIDGFDTKLATSEDFDICERITEIGIKLFSHPALSVIHLRNPKNLKEFFTKETWHGNGVLQNFICNFPKVKFNKALLFAIAMFILSLSTALGTALWVIHGYKLLFIISVGSILIVPLGLSIKSVSDNNKWLFLFPLMVLYMVYGFSRVVTIFNFGVWNHSLRIRKMAVKESRLTHPHFKRGKDVLFVTPRLPYPIDTGAKVRTFNLLKQAKANGVGLSLLSFIYDEEEKKYVKVLKEMGIEVITVKGKDRIDLFTIMRAIFNDLPLNIAKYHCKNMISAINNLVSQNNIGLVHFDHLHLGQYVDYCNGTPSIIDEHNVESLLLKRICEKERNFFKRMILEYECTKMAKFEKEKCLKASRVLTVSDEDKNNLENICMNGLGAETVPNGVNTEYFKSQSSKVTKPTKEDALVFTGSMDWLPNIDAVHYFCKDILPLIWEAKRDIKFYIVGRNSSEDIINLGKRDERITVTGVVDDVRPYMELANVFVVPLRIGGGTRLKILEAMAMGKPVVSTTIGAEGIDYTEDIDILLADEPQSFADKVISVLDNEDTTRNIGAAGRDLVCKKYDWKIIGKRLDKIYGETINA